MKILILALALSLAACNTNSGTKLTQEQVIELSCNTIALGNNVIAEGIRLHKIKGKENLDKIQAAKDYVHPICNPDSGVYPTLSELAMKEFEERAADLAAAKATAENHNGND
jgi:hypothetical protein